MSYIKPLVLSTTVNFPNKLHESLKRLNLRPALYILMQNSLILNACHIFSKFLAEESIRSVGQWTYSFESQLNCSEVMNVDGDDDDEDDDDDDNSSSNNNNNSNNDKVKCKLNFLCT